MTNLEATVGVVNNLRKIEVQTHFTRFFTLLRVVLLVECLIIVAGCGKSPYGDRKGTPLETANRANAPVSTVTREGSSSAADSATQATTDAGGQQGSLYPGVVSKGIDHAAPRPHCPVNREVRNPPEGSAEWVVADILNAALEPDGDSAFERFYGHFMAQHERGWVRQQYWPRAREHVRKYIVSENPLVYRICRELTPEPGQLKLFLRSYDEKKSDPPITLRQTAGVWRIEFYTP
ncbi:MAG: hypothetical protein HUU55_10330 [Myxococcales bacterium]|nr:hypothetical protein [Myxococcales bacterium]